MSNLNRSLAQYLLDEAKIIKYVFEENIHEGLVKGSLDILRFLASTGALAEDHIRAIWRSATV